MVTGVTGGESKVGVEGFWKASLARNGGDVAGGDEGGEDTGCLNGEELK